MATEEIEGEELEAVLNDLERKIERLRVAYEQYFLGIEKVVPLQRQKAIVRIIYRLQQAKLRGAQGKFRFNSLMQRFNAHKAYWNRTVREIEEGKYKRQTFRQKQRERLKQFKEKDAHLTTEDYLAIRMIKDTQGEEAAAEAEAARKAARRAELEDAASDFMDQLGQGTTPGVVAEEVVTASGAAGDPPRRPPPEIRGMASDEVERRADKLKELRERMKVGNAAIEARREAQASAQAQASARRSSSAGPEAGRSVGSESARRPPVPDVDREVYDRFVAAKRSLDQNTENLSFDSVKSSLDKQRAKVRQKHNCARVDFDVVVKDGKAFLKPVPVKDT